MIEMSSNINTNTNINLVQFELNEFQILILIAIYTVWIKLNTFELQSMQFGLN